MGCAMRYLPLVVVLLLCGCASAESGTATWPEMSEARPAMGNDATRDGFYDGGVFDPDLTRRDLPVAE